MPSVRLNSACTWYLHCCCLCNKNHQTQKPTELGENQLLSLKHSFLSKDNLLFVYYHKSVVLAPDFYKNKHCCLYKQNHQMQKLLIWVKASWIWLTSVMDTFLGKGNLLPVIRDCSLLIGSTGMAFRGTGQGLFLMLPSTGHKDFLFFYVMGHECFFGKKNLSNYIL